MIYFTSDHHFGHTNILKYTSRGEHFKTAEEMNEHLIQKWNSQVKNNDTVYHLGDFYLGHPDGATEILKKLNGNIHLIKGNHDRFLNATNKRFFGSIKDYNRLRFEDYRINLFHYPILEWDGKYHGSMHLFGHSHGNIQMPGRALDVGVDNFEKLNPGEYGLFSMDDVLELLLPEPYKYEDLQEI